MNARTAAARIFSDRRNSRRAYENRVDRRTDVPPGRFRAFGVFRLAGAVYRLLLPVDAGVGQPGLDVGEVGGRHV
ncbi:hypothetical protein, partial [Streptomyces sp. NPDC041003]|uniref:hypothetical protein n=1 Tax=Streptomyces sp. NPDC041003 TaxID=3155730 RepID=UPI0033CCF7F2